MEALTKKIDYDMDSFADPIERQLRSLEEQFINERIWERDATLWKDEEESIQMISNSLGWLNVPTKMALAVPQIMQFVNEVRLDGLTHVVVMGMGGSSIAPLVLKDLFQTNENGLKLFVLDTTDPTTIQAIERKVPLENTLFIVASKSGLTAETNALGDYFYNKIKALKGNEAGRHFVAITDKGTPLVDKAQALRYRQLFLNFEYINGHYSILSYFGIVPAALMGLDVTTLLERASLMQKNCQRLNTPSQNSALMLGAVLGELAIQHRNKLTLVLPDPLSAFGLWLEQLIAVSTGKEGKGILPITGEALLDPAFYRDDRLFVYLNLQRNPQPEVTEKLSRLTDAGHPLVTIAIDDKIDIAEEFYRWEMAVMVACSILQVNPFDQPNVRESVQRTGQILSKFEKEEILPVMDPSITEGPLTFFTYRNKFNNAEDLVDTFLDGEHAGDYLAIQAFLPEEPRTDQLLQKFRTILQQRLKRAVTVSFGPRFLYATGQYHKGGANTGLFIQLTADDEVDIDIPDKKYSFSIFNRAQADGDFTLMLTHSRRIIRVGLNEDIHGGMAKLIDLVEGE